MSPDGTSEFEQDLGFDAARVLLGTELAGTYRVEGLLGQGGMAHVFLAVDERTGARVAIKALTALRDGTGDGELVKRFRREADATSRLSHPNIVKILGSGMARGLPYLVLEYLDAPTAAAVLRRTKGGLPLESVRTIARGVCEALAFAHQRHFLHRDIKPANVFVRADGTPVLADFGLVKGPDYTKMTKTGVMLGTPAYLCPEALAGAGVDHRGDIYQVGLLIRELLTGSMFVADWLAGLVGLVPSPDQCRPLIERRPDTPPWLVRVVERCLERAPERRYQSVRDLLAEFDDETPTKPTPAQALDTPPAAQTPVRSASATGHRPEGLRSFALLAAVALVAAGTLAAARWLGVGGAAAPFTVDHFTVQPLRRALVAKVVTNRPSRAMVVCRTASGEARTVESTTPALEHEFTVAPLDGRQEYRVTAIASADGLTAQSTERTLRPGSRVDLAKLRVTLTRRELLLSSKDLGERVLLRAAFETRGGTLDLLRTPEAGVRWSTAVAPATSGSLSFDVAEVDGRAWRFSGLLLEAPPVRLPPTSLVGLNLMTQRLWTSGSLLRSTGREAVMAAVARSGLGRVTLPLQLQALRARPEELDYLGALTGSLAAEGVTLELVSLLVPAAVPDHQEALRAHAAALGALGGRFTHLSCGWAVDALDAVAGGGWRQRFEDLRTAARRLDPSVGCSLGCLTLQGGADFLEAALADGHADCLHPVQVQVPTTVRPLAVKLRQSLAGLRRIADRAGLPLHAILAYPIAAQLPRVGQGGVAELGFLAVGAKLLDEGAAGALSPAEASSHLKNLTDVVAYGDALRLLIRTTLETWAAGCRRIEWMDPVHVLASPGAGGKPCGPSTLAVLAHWLDGARAEPDGALAPALNRFGFEAKDPSSLQGCVARRGGREFLVVWPTAAGSSRRLTYVGPGDVVPLVRLQPVPDVVAEVTFFDGAQSAALDVEEPLIIFPPLAGCVVPL